MKNLIVLFILLTTSFNSFANEADLEAIEKLPALTEIKLNVNYGPRFAAVQPTVHIEFTHSTCARMKFKVEIVESETVNFLKVDFDGRQRDCRALPRPHNYKLQVSSDYRHGAKKFVLLNPLSQKIERSFFLERL